MGKKLKQTIVCFCARTYTRRRRATAAGPPKKAARRNGQKNDSPRASLLATASHNGDDEISSLSTTPGGRSQEDDETSRGPSTASVSGATVQGQTGGEGGGGGLVVTPPPALVMQSVVEINHLELEERMTWHQADIRNRARNRVTGGLWKVMKFIDFRVGKPSGEHAREYLFNSLDLPLQEFNNRWPTIATDINSAMRVKRASTVQEMKGCFFSKMVMMMMPHLCAVLLTQASFLVPIVFRVFEQRWRRF